MQIIRYSKKETWAGLLKRPVHDSRELEKKVRPILNAVKHNGDGAVRRFTKLFDDVDLKDLRVCQDEFDRAEKNVSMELKAAIKTAKSNIEKFHSAQMDEIKKIETTEGVVCWRKSVPIERVGLYVPAGTAPLFSTVLMLAIPATIAGCREIVLCSPPSIGGIADVILYSAKICGVTDAFKIGGAQAIGAMAFGTETVPCVYKIFGPGNQFVTCAKHLVSNEVAIDMPAGPSELAVLADDSCNPAFVAADLLSQAEHGPDSQVLLVTASEAVIDAATGELKRQIVRLPRRQIAERCLANSRAILVEDLDDGIALVNEYAAEHLILAVIDAETVADKITNAGSVFIGNYSCESAGDYASGTNHTLPTGGFAKSFGGVSLDSFVKKITFQEITADGIRNLGPTIECMAEAEGLAAHKRAISIRREVLDGV